MQIPINTSIKRVIDILDAMNAEEMDTFNDINGNLPNDNTIHKGSKKKTDILREKHLELRDGYDRLFRKSAKGWLF